MGCFACDEYVECTNLLLVRQRNNGFTTQHAYIFQCCQFSFTFRSLLESHTYHKYKNTHTHAARAIPPCLSLFLCRHLSVNTVPSMLVVAIVSLFATLLKIQFVVHYLVICAVLYCAVHVVDHIYMDSGNGVEDVRWNILEMRRIATI